MRVLMFSETLWPYGSGGEVATYLYAVHLSNSGIEVGIVIRDRRSSELWEDLKVYRLSTLGYGKYLAFKPSDVGFVKNLARQYDVAYFTGIFNLIPLVKSLGKPIVAHIHSYFPLCPVGHLYNFTSRKICDPDNRNCLKCIWIYESAREGLKRALASSTLNSLFKDVFLDTALVSDALIFVSEEQRRLFLDYVKVLREDSVLPESYVIYNPVPKVNYVPIKGNDIGFLGGLDPIKGWSQLLQAWLRVLRRFPKARLRATKTSSLPTSIEQFNVVRYPRLSLLEKFYEYVRAIVVPSIAPEPSPYVVVEALLHGRLLIASRVGGIPEIVGGASGVKLVPPSDIDALTDALDWALSMDRKSVIELGLRNREYALKKFDNEASIKKLIEILRDLC